jgi:peptidoglycan/LPS O-acetylase OafA/YrhL
MIMLCMVTSTVPQGVELSLAKRVRLAPAYRPDIDGLRAIAVLVSAVAATAILLPSDLVRFGEYLSATTVFLTNFTGWRAGADYFRIPAAHEAIRHLCSIATEERLAAPAHRDREIAA